MGGKALGGKAMGGKAMMLSGAMVVMVFAASAQTFEVASIKPTPPPDGGPRVIGTRGGPGSSDPTRVRLMSMSVVALVSEAWDMSALRISGPAWTGEDTFEIVATMAPGTTKEQYRVMLRNLLTERFGLVIHREPRVVSLYALTVGKGGSKLKTPQPDRPADAATDAKPRQSMTKDAEGYPVFAPGLSMTAMFANDGKPRAGLQAHNESVDWLVKMLAGQLKATVVDETGLTGKYDFAMRWVPEDRGGVTASETADPAGPSLTGAVEEQLGLRLTRRKSPLEFIVIDRAERKPSEN